MADTQLTVGGEASATDAEVRELDTALTDATTKDNKSVDVDDDGDGTDGDGAGHVEEEERTGKVDAELANAANEADREAIRERRRQERQNKKNRARERTQTLERQIAQLTRDNQEMLQTVQQLSQQSQGFQMARLDAAINEVGEAVVYFEGLIADAATKGDGETVAKATSNLMAARERAKELKEYKEAAVKSSGQKPQKALDPEVINHAKKFMEKNRWYGGPRSDDLDSRVLSQIDNQVSREGFDPRGPEYWAELETRTKRYLPHRFQSGGNANGVDDDANDGGASADGQNGYNGRASNGDRRPRQPVAGNSGDARGPKGGGEGYHLSAERVKAIKESGNWDDPAARKKMIDAYKAYDREHASR